MKKSLLGKNHRILNSGNQPKEYWEEMYQVLEQKGIWQDEVKNKSKNGKYYWVDTTVVPLYDSREKIDCYISIRTDITKYKRIQEELEEYQNNLEKIVQKRTMELGKVNEQLKMLSEIDTLTNLYNRRKLEIDFNQEIQRARRSQDKMALFFIDLDKFKKVNDTYGHETGDALLQNISVKVLAILRQNEFLYRIGGDEFCILVPKFIDLEELETIAKRLIKVISNIKTLNSAQIDIGCSIGISIFPTNGETLDQLISSADKAMYQVKKSGKNNYSFNNKD